MTVLFPYLLLALILLNGVLYIVLFLPGPRSSDRHLAWLAGGYIPNQEQADVYRAYLKRHNRGRFLGGLVGIVLGLVVIARWGGDQIFSIGFGIPMPYNILVWWIGGAVVGTLFGESYRLPRRKSVTVRRAVLESRPQPPLPSVVSAARLLAGLSVVIFVIGTVLGEAGGTLGVLFIALVVVMAELTQRAITNRERPSTQQGVMVDERLRWFAGSSLAWLELAGASLGYSTAAGAWLILINNSSSHSWWSILGITVLTVSSWMAGIGSIVAFFRSRMRPPRPWVPGMSPTSRAKPDGLLLAEMPS